MRMTRTAILAIVACVLGVAAGAAVFARKPAATAPAARATPAFAEAKWPFLMDQWGVGRAFRCGAETCGTDVDVYVRAKIGFCNCTTGVSDDDELERVGDIELIGAKYQPTTAGHPIAVAWMKGRSRPYDVQGRAAGSTLALAFNDHCDVIVATAVVPQGSAARVEPAVLAFLNSDTVLNWAKQALGL